MNWAAYSDGTLAISPSTISGCLIQEGHRELVEHLDDIWAEGRSETTDISSPARSILILRGSFDVESVQDASPTAQVPEGSEWNRDALEMLPMTLFGS